jgi:hypothetical protein
MRKVDYHKFSTAAVTLAIVILAGGSGRAQAGNGNSLPDAQIEANVLKSMAGAPQLASENIITNTVYGTVTLSGTVKDESTRQMAETLASRAEGVKKVVDELTLGTGPASQGNISQSPNSALQSDGTMAPTPGQHAPDPDVYAQQHGIIDAGPQTGQSNPPDVMANNAPAPGNRQPYAPNGGGPAPYPQSGPTPYPQGGPQQPYPQGGQQPYPQGGPGNYQGQRNSPPPPYGAQVAGQPVTVPPGSLLRIRINEGLDSKHTQPGTQFDATVLNDVIADGAVAIPRGASVQGTVIEAKDGGVIKGHGQLALKLNQVTLSGKTFPIVSDAWTADGPGKGGQTVGSAVGLGAFGALIGAVAGGGPGAAIGAGAGAAAGIGASAASGRREVVIPAEAILTFHLTQPAPMVTISQAEMDRLSYGVPNGGPPQVRRRYPPPPAYYGPVYYPRPYPY